MTGPPATAAWACSCPTALATARLHIVEGGGHMVLSQLDQIIEDLAPHAT